MRTWPAATLTGQTWRSIAERDDPLTLYPWDYIRLPGPRPRVEFDEWVDEVLGVEWRTKALPTLILGEGYVDTVEYVYDEAGRFVLLDGDGVPVRRVRRVACRRPPPVWKPLR